MERPRSTFLGGGGRHAVVVDLPADLSPVMADRRRVVQVLNHGGPRPVARDLQGVSSRRKAVASMPSAQAAAAARPSPFTISAARYDADPGCASSGGVPARPRSPRGCSVDRGAGVPVGPLMWHRPPRARLAGYTSRPAAAAAPREVGIGALRVEGVSPAAGRGAATVHRHPTAGGPPGVLPANRRGSRRRGRWGLARGLPPELPDLQGRTELKTQDLVQRPRNAQTKAAEPVAGGGPDALAGPESIGEDPGAAANYTKGAVALPAVRCPLSQVPDHVR